MKRVLVISFIAASFCHALVLFAVGFKAPAVLPVGVGYDSVGIDLVGAASEADTSAVTPNSESAPEPLPEPEPVSTESAVPDPHLESIVEPSPDALPTPQPLPTATPKPSLPVVPSRPSSGPPASRHVASQSKENSGLHSANGAGPNGQAGGSGPDTMAKPRYRNNPPPAYPITALRNRRQGVVLVAIEVSADGRPLETRLKQSSGFLELDEAAIQAVRRWRFDPARRAGIPIESRVDVPVVFRLDNH